ncbi:MAG: hypothetical protein QXQ87_02120 [Halobacteria archaeon]
MGPASPGSQEERPATLNATFTLDPVLVAVFNRMREVRPEDWKDCGPWNAAYAMFLQASARLLWTQVAAPMEINDWLSELR